MKLNVKNTARLAVTAGLCASLTLGGLPVGAIAAELDVTPVDAVVNVEGEGSAAGDKSGAAAGDRVGERADATDGDKSGVVTDEQAGAPADGDQADGKAPVKDAPAANGSSAGDPSATAAKAPKAEDGTPEEGDEETALFKGAGTAEDPYQIGSAADLKAFAEKINAGDATYKEAHYKQSANIDLSDVVDWAPIGTTDNMFEGTFDGTGFTISNLTVNLPEGEGVGLFGYIGNPAKLTGITVENATVTGRSDVGVIAGAALAASASNCTVKGTINVTGNYKVGGMFGGGYVKLDNCHVNATGSVTGTYAATNFEGDNVGGLIGFRGEGSTITTTDCSVSGISVAGSRKVGGIVGSAFADNSYTGCSVSNVKLACNAPHDYASGTAKNQLCVGGLVGIFIKRDAVGTVSNCAVSNVAFSVTDPKVAEENLPIMGVVSGGYRASSFSGASAPDGKIKLEGLKVSGTNTGMNADKKFPGSVAMNGTSNVFDQGTGTAEDPYIISSTEELDLFRTAVNTTGLTYDGQYLKVADGVELDLSTEKWTSIGTSSKKFMGTFDGNGVTIKGLTKGLFGYVQNATVKNVNLVDVNVSAAGALIQNATDAIHISNITVSGAVSTSGDVAGVVGVLNLKADGAQAEISNCTNNATITAKSGFSTPAAGGILGAMKVTGANVGLVVANCTNNGAISGQIIGGICAESQSGTFDGCKNTGELTGATMKATSTVGGIVGVANAGTSVKNSVNTASVTSEDRAGGIVGVSSSGGNTFSRCANSGDVSGAGDVGGIGGGSYAAGDHIDNCYNSGSVETTGQDAIAGGIFSDYSVFAITGCFNEGAVSAKNGTAYQIGKNSGKDHNVISGCYYKEGDKFFLSAANGTSAGAEQTGMTRGGLADALNAAGGVPGFWQAQNGSVQPDPLIPGAWDDEGKAVVEILDAEGNAVERYESVEVAFAAVKDGQTIKMIKDDDISDLSADAPFVIAEGVNATFDLNGHVLKAANRANLVVQGNLTLVDSTDTQKNGTGKGKILAVKKYGDNAGKGIIQVDANGALTMESGLIDCASEFAGNNVNDGQRGITIWGDSGDTAFIMNGGKILAGWSTVAGNGNHTAFKGSIVVNGGILESTSDYAISSPQAGGVTINGGEVVGAAGAVHMQRGELKITGGDLVSKGTGDTGKWPDGTSGSGNAVVCFSAKYGPIESEISGGAFVAEGDAEMFYEGTKNPVDVAVSGGTFNKEIPDTYLAEGYGLLEKDENGNYVVHKHEMVAKFNENGHWTECTKCGEKTKVIPHSKGELKNAKDATCTEDGYTGDQVCECGYVLKKGEVTPALGHDWSKWSVTEPTCTKDGEKTRTCSACGEKETEVIPATGHTAEKWTSNSTDHWKVCDECGEAFDVASHEFGDWKVTEEPTATEKGEREHACKVCGKVVSEEIPALGQKPADKPADKGDKPGKDEGGKLAQTGDASMLGIAATGIAGALATAAGVITRRRRK